MTTEKDNFENRVASEKLGLGQELTVGVPADGMQNASGDYPKREYNFGSSINKAALGLKINKLYTGGGDYHVPLDIPEQMPSQYPFNQVDETPSGHSIEMDDTPGGERILIRHRKGSGVELRADGTVVVSALNNKVEVTGGDQTLIVEGDGTLVYNGTLNLRVKGDMNIDVGGSYNVNTGGNTSIKTKRNHYHQVSGDASYDYHGENSQMVVADKTTVVLGDKYDKTKRENYISAGGKLELASGGALDISAQTDLSQSALNVVVNANGVLKMVGSGEGSMIGGAHCDFTGRTFSGGAETATTVSARDDSATDDGGINPSGFQTATFHGSFHGTADKAIHASKANTAITSTFSLYVATGLGAVPQGVAGWAAALATGLSTVSAVSDLLAGFGMEQAPGGYAPIDPKDIRNTIQGKGDQTLITEKGIAIRKVVIDPGNFLVTQLKGSEHYSMGGFSVFDREPTLEEIRVAMRNQTVRQRGAGKPSFIGTLLIAEDKINPYYLNKTPPGTMTGRTSKKEDEGFVKLLRGNTNPIIQEARYGKEPIGNSIENKGKRFR
jgi:hypothetical protein